MRRVLTVAGVTVVVAAVFAGSQLRPVAAQDDAAKPAYYTQKVRPVLEDRCASCHMNGNFKGGLGLETKAQTMQGGDSGASIVPGDAAHSLLVKMIRGEGPAKHPVMPPGGNKISDEDIAAITAWVQAGAVMPDTPQAGPGGMGMGMPRGGGARGQTMDLVSANKMIAAVVAVAVQEKQHVAVCVMDTNGDIVAFERMDLTDRIPLSTSQGKARAVLLFGIPTGAIADAQRDKKPVTSMVTAPPIGGGGGEITLMRGGLPIMKDGKMIGSIGVGGSASEEDERFAQIGIAAAGLSSSSAAGTPK